MQSKKVKTGISFATRLEFDLLSQEAGWWDKKLDEVRETGQVGLEGGRWSYSGVIRWVRGDEARSAKYDEALQDYAHKVALECIPIADTAFVLGPDGEMVQTDVARDRLRTDVRLKLAGKWDRTRYGEHVTVDRKVSVVDETMLLTGMVELLRLAATRPRLPMVEVVNVN